MRYTNVYKMEWETEKYLRVNDGDFVNCPEKLFAFRVYELCDALRVTAIITDCDEFNQVNRNTLYRYVGIAQDALFINVPIPEWICRKPLNNVIAYEQAGLNVLIKFYEPLVHSLARKAYDTLDKWYNYNDLVQQCYLAIISLHNQGYYCSKGLIERAFFNDLFVALRKLPTKCTVISFDEPIDNVQNDDAIVKVIDTLADTNDDYEPILQDIDLIIKRNKIISIIGRRQYDQLLREFRTHTVSRATATKINKLKKRINKNGKLQ